MAPLSTPYNRFSSYGGYSSPYNSSFSSPYNSYSSPYSSYSSPYSSYSSPYNRYSSYSQMGGPMNPQGNTGPTATLDVLQQIIFAFSTFAQMLESTFHATQSSFFAMLGVADQFGHLKEYFKGIFSVVTMYGAFKDTLKGLVPFHSARGEIDAGEFDSFQMTTGRGAGGRRKPFSFKPLFLFMFAVVGVPYFFRWFRRKLEQAAREGHATRNTIAQNAASPQVDVTSPQDAATAGSMQAITFAKALHNFKARSTDELSLSKGDIVAIISRTDPSTGQESLWWKGKLRKGPVGWFPASYVTLLKKQPALTHKNSIQMTISNDATTAKESLMGAAEEKQVEANVNEFQAQTQQIQ
jgi:peroxin-13